MRAAPARTSARTGVSLRSGSARVLSSKYYDADRTGKISDHSAFLRITGDIQFALWCAMTGKAGLTIVFGQEHPKRKTPLEFNLFGKGLALRPARIQESGLENIFLPGVGARLSVTNQVGGAVTLIRASCPAIAPNSSFVSRAKIAGMNPLNPTPIRFISA